MLPGSQHDRGIPPVNKITPRDLRDEAAKFETTIGTAIATASALLESTPNVENANFTAVHKSLAIAYTEALNFSSQDLASKEETATDYRSKLEATADNWQKAEDASDVALNGKSDL
jgi:hypothetical protein